MIRLDQRGQMWIAAGALGLALGVYLFTREPAGAIPDQHRFVCVATGQFYDLSTAAAGMIPARNPQTGQYTLVLCAKDAEGAWRVMEDNRGIVEEQLQDCNKWVDPQTLRIRAPK